MSDGTARISVGQTASMGGKRITIEKITRQHVLASVADVPAGERMSKRIEGMPVMLGGAVFKIDRAYRDRVSMVPLSHALDRVEQIPDLAGGHHFTGIFTIQGAA